MLFFLRKKKQVYDDCSNFESSLKEGRGEGKRMWMWWWCGVVRSSGSGDDDDLTGRMGERKQGLGVYTGRETEGVWMCWIKRRETYQERKGRG